MTAFLIIYLIVIRYSMTNNTRDAYQSLVQHLTELTDSQEIEAVLAALLTDKELQDIANRVRIFDLLQQGVTQRAISQQLGSLFHLFYP